MAHIKCREFDCKYNYCEACMKNSIEVSDDALCDSFDTKQDGSPIDMEMGLEEDFFVNGLPCDSSIENVHQFKKEGIVYN